jgi:hypothetical protein
MLAAPGSFSLTMRVRLNRTSSAVNGLPWWVVTPSGMTMVHSVPSALGSIEVASDSCG